MSQPVIDIGILTIREDEFRAVLKVFPDDHDIHKGRHREYTLRTADAGQLARYRLAILRQIEQGNGEAQEAARDLCDDLEPSLFLVVGIADGLPSDDISLGDVVLSTRRATRDKTPMLSIRGLSDIVGLKRQDTWTKYACASAAAFTRGYLRTRPVSVRQSPKPEAGPAPALCRGDSGEEPDHRVAEVEEGFCESDSVIAFSRHALHRPNTEQDTTAVLGSA
jgi:nucleoside phosphorylase